MTRARCDATYATDDDGREGFQTVIVSKLAPGDPGTASVPVGAFGRGVGMIRRVPSSYCVETGRDYGHTYAGTHRAGVSA